MVLVLKIRGLPIPAFFYHRVSRGTEDTESLLELILVIFKRECLNE
jgi:hypothetical protein